MQITACWATPQQQLLQLLELPDGTSIADALLRLREDLTDKHPQLALQIGWQAAAVGVFGELRPRSSLLRDGDRLEIHRPLQLDPKEGRRQRAQRLRKGS